MTAYVTPLLVWTITPPEPSSPLQGSYTLGYEFQTATTQKINHLGLYLPSTSSGFSSSHTITLWNSSQSVLATATVPAGPCVSIDYFCWFPLDGSPGLEVSLPPGTYRVGAFYDTNPSGFTNDPFVSQISPSGIVINPNPTVSGNFVRGYAGVGNVYPNLGANTSIRSYFGPNVGFLSATPYSGPTGQLWPLGVPDPLPVKSDPLMVWTNTPPSPSKLPFSATVGFEFQLGATRRVEELGIYATPVGFTSEHKLTLWNSSQTPLATATVSSGVHTTTDYFHWVPIDGPPGSYVTLPPGTYRVGAFYDVDNTGFSNDAFIEQVSISSIGVNPTVSANYIIGYSGPGDTYPSFAGDPSFRSFFGPNVRFKSTPTGQLWPIGSIFPKESAINPLLKFNPLEPPGPYEEESYYVSTSVTVGYQFGIGVNKIVNKLGVYYPQGPSGFIHPVTIKLWTATSPPVLLLTATIPAGPCSNVVDGFCWVSVPETTLISGPTSSLYRLGAFYEYDEVTGLSPFVSYYPLSDLIVAEPFTSYTRGFLTAGDAYPSTPGPIDTANYFGPNISFKKGPTGQIWPA